MKALLLVLLTTVSIAFLSSVTLAQPGGGGRMGMSPEKRIVELIAQLDVTPEQEAGFREAMQQIGTTRMARMRQGRGGNGASQSDERSRPDAEAMMARQAEAQKQETEILAGVLNAAQVEKYLELEQARMANRMERSNRQ